MPYLELIDTDEADKVIRPRLASLKDLEQVNNGIIIDTRNDINDGLISLLNRRKINQQDYQNQIKQCGIELKQRESAGGAILQQISRFLAIQLESPDENLSFIIENTLTMDELNHWIELIKSKLTLSSDANEKLFLTVLLQNVQACKIHLDEHQSFNLITIPLLKSEQKYAFRMLFQSFAANKNWDDLFEQFVNQLEINREIEKAAKDDHKLSSSEKAILQSLCKDLGKEIRIALHAIVTDSFTDEAIFKYQKNIEQSIAQAELRSREIPVGVGFMGFINLILIHFNFKPMFTITDSPIVSTIGFFKEQIFPGKTEQKEQPQSKFENN